MGEYNARLGRSHESEEITIGGLTIADIHQENSSESEYENKSKSKKRFKCQKAIKSKKTKSSNEIKINKSSEDITGRLRSRQGTFAKNPKDHENDKNVGKHSGMWEHLPSTGDDSVRPKTTSSSRGKGRGKRSQSQM